MKRVVIRIATEQSKAVFAVIFLLVLAFAALMTRIQIDTDPENMLPADQPDRMFHNLVEERFNLHDAIVVGLVNDSHSDGIFNVASLAALHSLSRSILELEGVIAPDVMSLAETDNIAQAGVGTIRFEWMMKDAPVTQAQALDIRTKVDRLPLLMDTLISGDGKAAMIYVPIASKDLSYPLSLKIKSLSEQLETDDHYHITGLPVAEDTFGHDMFVQMGISAPLAGLVIFLLMIYFFRSVTLVIAPMLVAMATVIITMGALIGMGFTVHVMSSMIPIFLMPIAVVDSVHIMSEFADQYRPGSDAKAGIAKVVSHLFRPMLFTSLTSAVGFLSLLLTPIPPVQVFGAFVAFGIVLAFVLTIVLIPAYVVKMSPKSLAKLALRSKIPRQETPLTPVLRSTGRAALKHGKLVSGIALALIAISVVGISQIQINDNPLRWFKENHPIRIADRVLNEHFAGTYDAFLVLTYNNAEALQNFKAAASELMAELDPTLVSAIGEQFESDTSDLGQYFGNLVAAIDDAIFESGDERLDKLMTMTEQAQVKSKYFQRPDVLMRISAMQKALVDSGYVGKTSALPDVVKVVNRELRGGEKSDYRIPDTVPGVAQTLLQYQSSHRPQDLWHIVTPDYSSTAIWLQLKSGDNQDMSRVIEAFNEHLRVHPLGDKLEMRWAGKTFLNVVWQNAMVSGMLKSLLGAFVVVFLMMAFLFRSLRLGILAMVPLSLTIVGVYGIIGWIGKDYDMPIAVLSSLTLGLSVDFSIHFIERTRSLLHSSASFSSAMESIFEEPARAIARNVIVIALGFTPLFFAPLVPYITVGAFMAAVMIFSGLSTLVLLPALMSWSGRWLFPHMAKQGAFKNFQTLAADPSG